MKEAMFYKKGATVVCQLCYRSCKIASGKKGFCGIRENRGGKLYALTYGHPCSYAVDPIEKKPFFHFRPGTRSFSLATVGCNFRCLHCQNHDISQPRQELALDLDLAPEQAIELARGYGCQGLSYTYTEPTVFFEYCYDIGKLARKEKLYNTFVTNGYTQTEPIKKAREFLDAARIDLKGDEKHYIDTCGGVELEKVLKSIKNYYNTGMHIEIITLVIEKDNDNKDFVQTMADFLKDLSPSIPWHFIAFYPAYKMINHPATSIKTLERMHDWAKKEGMKYVYSGNVPGHKYENTYCHNCGELLIERRGFQPVRIDITEPKCPSCREKIPIVL